MVGVSPMHNGKFDQRTQDDLRLIGKWLGVNGEAIYSTRGMFVEDDQFKFTRSKDSKTIYAIHKGLNTGKIRISNISDVTEDLEFPNWRVREVPEQTMSRVAYRRWVARNRRKLHEEGKLEELSRKGRPLPEDARFVVR